MNQLAVVIVNYNVKHYLRQCLDSVLRATRDIKTEIWVVDNHSSDGSIDLLRPLYADVQFIVSQDNLGFSRANNLALRQIDAQYVLLLNPDTFVGEQTLHDALAFMEAHPQAGAVGVKMLNSDGTKALESRRGIPTPMTALYKMLGLCKFFPKHRKFGRYYMSGMPWDEAAPIEIVSGAFFLTSKSVLDQVGLLDQDFFMYGEDIDLSYRILKAGYTNWYLPSAILHYKGESTHKSSYRYVHVFYKAMLIFLRKHYRHLRLWITLPIQLAIGAKAMLTLMRIKLRSMRKTLGLTSYKNAHEMEYILVSDASRTDLVKHIHRTTGTTVSFVEKSDHPQDNTPDAILERLQKQSASTSIVYDTGVFSYESVLQMMENDNARHLRIGTLNPDSRTIITQTHIITYPQ